MRITHIIMIPLGFISLLVSCQTGKHDLHVSSLFSEGMVLQQQERVALWGKSRPEVEVTVRASWGAKATTHTDLGGEWMVRLETPEAGGPYVVEISSGTDSIKINDVLIGEVWLAAGQSNMEMDFDYCRNTTDNAEQEISTANFPNIRMFTVKKNINQYPTSDVGGSWGKAVGAEITYFSAPAYFFAKKLHHELNVPIGIIHSSWGGSRAEAWTSRETLEQLHILNQSVGYYDSLATGAMASESWFSQFKTVTLPSIGWEFYLSVDIERHAPQINYTDFFIEQWRSIDFNDEEQLTMPGVDPTWDRIDLPTSIKNIFKTNDFSGITLLKREFELESNIDEDVWLQINPGEDMGWDLMEIDCYVNGVRVGSTLGNPGEDIMETYQAFPERYLPAIEIPRAYLKTGKNEIALRVIGTGELKGVQLTSPEGKDKDLNGEWYYRVWAEIYGQLDDHVFPYLSFYLYDRSDIDFSQRPLPVSYDQLAYASIFNAMLYPLIPYGIKGALWYQGESNAFEGEAYSVLFPEMVADWRKRWGMEFPLYYAQIAPYYGYVGHGGSFREVQRKCLDIIPRSGMVVTLDLSENYDIHPSNKHDVGYRYAKLALVNDYDRSGVASGPIYKGHKIIKNEIEVRFDYTGSGLFLKEAEISEFEIAGSDTIFVEAQAEIVDDWVKVYSPLVPQPQFVRYAWSDTSVAILFNREGLPASTFSSF